MNSQPSEADPGTAGAITRRDFLGTTVKTAAALSMVSAPMVSSNRVLTSTWSSG
jgi:hypothetical protein